MNLKQLSDLLGLSQTTVSRALNGYPEVSAKTRARVQRAAKEHHYSPNTRAKGLATGTSMAIGHVIPMAAKHEMVNPIFADFIAGAAATYSANGYDMLLSMVDDSKVAQSYRSLQSRGAVDGVIVHSPTVNDSRLTLLDEIGLPYAVHGRASGHGDPYCWLDVNNKSAFSRATTFLTDLGHRRIALINGQETLDFATRRRVGYENGLRAAGVAVDPAIMRSDEMTEAFGYRSTVDLLAMDAPPTAILVSSMICALGVRRALDARGLKMGRDVSVLTHDDALSYLETGETIPAFTATRSSVREAGEKLAQLLIDRITAPKDPPPHILLEAVLTVGKSTGPAPQSGL